MKKLIVLSIVIVCIVLMYKYPHTMLSPGELVEGHQKLNDDCLACHEPFWGISNDKCISCHKLSDIGRDTLTGGVADMPEEKILFHQNLTLQKCTSCHSDHKGKKPTVSISSFTHDILPSVKLNKCNSCHGQPADNLHKQLSTDCKSCHNTDGWKSSVTFNHDMIQGMGKTDCASCHQKPDDDFHRQLKENCDRCHSTSKWKPSTFDHSAYFELDKHHNVECKTCHINNNFSAFTCYGCHEHTENEMIRKHNEEGIFNITNCASCHRSGDEHDIRMNGNSKQELNEKDINNVKKYIKTEEKKRHKEGHDETKEDEE